MSRPKISNEECLLRKLSELVREEHPQAMPRNTPWKSDQNHKWEIYIWSMARQLGQGATEKDAWQSAVNNLLLDKLES